MNTVALHTVQLGNDLLRPTTIELPAGTISCLSGASGSGKSRFLRALADLEPHTGDVHLGDTTQSLCPAHQWRQHVRMVPAESQWWSDLVSDHFPAHYTAEEFPALSLPAEALHWHISRLSSGEKQRLGLLRALAYPLHALLLDEPTANLDSHTAHQTEVWLTQKIQDNRWPCLWVSHDEAQIQRIAARWFAISEGKIEEVVSWKS
ncbi:ABC transporter ATP-binding protein [Chrysiogenes arsenatis]|uniref:ABC transporter ATP-binding protein n=1 Tax=Chrysiogenes arsenatis TaxID=309797 RepID=UPI00042381CE|nr:ABC transporter ATP-binding protein [Chrysiogenes arsenatis]